MRRPLRPEQARRILGRRLARRADDFLALARAAIYRRRSSPYRELLRLAGCEYGDLERLVRAEGLEGALATLYRRGVFLSVEELKGRRPVVRGSAAFRVDPARIRGLWTGAGLRSTTSGSRGPATPVRIDLAFIRDRAVTTGMMLEARGGRRWTHAVWGMAGGWATGRVLEIAALGALPMRWFSPLDPSERGIDRRYGLLVAGLRAAGLLAGDRLPRPELVPLDRPEPIASWMTGVLERGGVPHLIATPSSVVVLAEAARAAGLSLRGAQFTMPGEPTTAARRAIIEAVGGQATGCYTSMESGPIGYGCLRPEVADDTHLLSDFQALIRTEGAGPLPPKALLVTSLRRTVPLVMLNTSLGDQAELAQRACGCALERLGWTTHLHSVRSFEKLTAHGVTFLDTDVIQVLEETLPIRFGGQPTDYQLVEDTVGDRAIVRLLVHPRLGEMDEEAVASAFLRALSASAASGAVWARLWQQAGMPYVERRVPRATPSGKIHHVHRERRGEAE